MEKIMVTIDPTKINVNLLDFSSYIARLTHSRLTGMFLDYVTTEDVTVSTGNVATIPREMSVRVFEDTCCRRSVNASVCYGRDLQDILLESRFANALIVDTGMSYDGKHDGTPSDFVTEILEKSECPVIISPSHFYEINEIVFVYDGSASSVFAMKQFMYLFSGFSGKRVRVIEVTGTAPATITQTERVLDLLKLHYPDVCLEVLKGKPSTVLLKNLLGRQHVFVVMGAFGKNMFSGFFRHSTAHLVIKSIDLPVFIAHRNGGL